MIYKNGYSKFNFPMNPYVRLLLVGRSVGCLDRSVIIEKAGRLYFIVSIGALVRLKIQNLGHKLVLNNSFYFKCESLSRADFSPHSLLPSLQRSLQGRNWGRGAPLLQFILFLRTCI